MLGWKYVDAEEDAQRYKIGKFILETGRVVKGGGTWEDGDEDESIIREEEGGGEYESAKSVVREDDIQFDSQDEDECEDLFAGVWSVELARRRRRNREFK